MAERLERLRDRAYSQIEVILKFAESITDTTPIEEITTRLDALETRYQAFNEYEVELFADDQYKPISEIVDEVYYKARARLMQSSAKRTTPSTESHDLNATLGNCFSQQRTFYEGITSSNQARLLKVSTEPFSGNYQYWPSFHDLYTTAVHKNTNLNNVHKFQILNGLLKGDAASLIRHISITEANYPEAWDKLCKRYSKLNPIINSLIQSFFDQKTCHQANGKELRRIAENADEVIRGLRALGSDAETRDPWLIYIMLMKLDNETKQLWAKESVNKNFPTFIEFIEFLNVRCDALEMCESTSKKPYNSVKVTAKAFLTNTDNPIVCIVCKNSHFIYKCPTFKNLPIDSRDKIVIENNLCRNCLRKGHTSSTCFNKASCLICNNRHHTLLHHSQIKSTTASSTSSHHTCSNESSNTQIEDMNSAKPTLSHCSSEPNQSTVLHTLYSVHDTILPTALVYVVSCTGKLQSARLLLDSGSQMSFVTESCIQNLGLKRSHSCISIHGLASTAAGTTKGKTDMTIISRVNKQYTINLTAHIIPRITNLVPINQQHFLHHPALKGLTLADPEFHRCNEIDILLGADAFFEVLSPEKKTNPNLPTLQNSKFGWFIAATFKSNATDSTNFHSFSNTSITTYPEDDVNQLLKRFWEVEEVPDYVKLTPSENWCESYFRSTTTRDASGRFSVRLPFKQPRQQLGSSWQTAYRRQILMEKRFSKSPEFFKDYKDFINEYIDLGHMNCIPWSEIPTDDNSKFYIPHHAVFKSTSSTTKLRVVFDASCKTTTLVSLNDILHVGPNIQRDLSSIVLRFRRHRIAFVADVEKMYRQIKVHPADANYQLILWRDTPNDRIAVYKLNTLTYGTACAPYLAVRTLQKSSENFQVQYPKAAHTICNDFYIDDVLSGCDSLEGALRLKTEIVKILASSGFKLREWKSNSFEFLQSFSPQDIESIPKLREDASSIKTLGIIWHSDSDTFGFKVQEAELKQNWTKRSILSAASKVNDPLRWLSPTVMLFKFILQKLWLLNVDWDTSLPDNIIKIWKVVYENMAHLENIKIPRCLTTLKNRKTIQLHAFCDASEAAYGSVIYLRVVGESGEITVNIVCAKGKVAPLKQISLPRLELCGAVLLCDLVKFCLEALEYDNIMIYAWTDSTIVLHWLSDVSRRWQSFIANRTSKILDVIPRSKWTHIESKQNPADYITRGVEPQQMSNLDHWWQGTKFLSDYEHNWPAPKQLATVKNDVSMEERPKFINVLVETSDSEDTITRLVAKCSSWFRLRKIMVYVLRFVKGKKLNRMKNRQGVAISPAELNEPEVLILRQVQKQAFKFELSTLAISGVLSSKQYLSTLDPFIDSKGLLRIGGRLRNSQLDYNIKHPIILLKDHQINVIIIREIHISHMHASNSLVLSTLRNMYWMIGARYTIKRVIKRCVICIRQRSKKSGQKMGPFYRQRDAI